MRRAVLTALVSVALVTAAGTMGASVVGDAARDTQGNPPDPFAGGDGLVESESNHSAGGDGGLPDIEDAFRIGGSTSETGENGSGSASGAGSDSGASGTGDGAGPTDSQADAGTDATGPDADGDDLPDGRETDVGTDPLAADTDDDGLPDGRELEVGTDPLAADTDGDELPDDHELVVGTDPTAPDTDGDGFPDDRELTVGTDPAAADTDGDRLLDSWEVRGRAPTGAELPGADPLAKDVYVQFDYAQGIERRDDAFYDALAAEFAEMPVDNPDNSSGVDVHVREGGYVNESARFTGDNFWTLKDRHYESELGARAGIYHQVLVTRFAGGQVGYGEVGGRFSVVASDLDNRTARRAVTHELLHNVVGRVEARGVCADDPKHYCAGGYLSPRFDPGEEQYLAEGLARQLERQGFAG